ncbi:MAG: hypothetical protein ACRDPH_14360, partial [Marmoricola sp.]
SWDEHDVIIDALVAGNEALAARTMRSHSEQTRKAYKEVSGAPGEAAARDGRPQEPGVHR